MAKIEDYACWVTCTRPRWRAPPDPSTGPPRYALADRDLMTLRGGMRAALVAGPDGHRFLVKERVRDYLP
jgi:hypothetical protein